jgi:hypothetical protein
MGGCLILGVDEFGVEKYTSELYTIFSHCFLLINSTRLNEIYEYHPLYSICMGGCLILGVDEFGVLYNG